MKPTPPAPETIPNVLAERYASPAMRELWSAHGRILLERDFWIAVMKAQKDLGVAIPAEAIRDYERVRDDVDVARIKERERVTLHDVKARTNSCWLSISRRRAGSRAPPTSLPTYHWFWLKKLYELFSAPPPKCRA